MGTVQGRVGRGKLGDFYHVKGKRGQGYWNRGENGGQRGDSGEGRFICLGVM